MHIYLNAPWHFFSCPFAFRHHCISLNYMINYFNIIWMNYVISSKLMKVVKVIWKSTLSESNHSTIRSCIFKNLCSFFKVLMCNIRLIIQLLQLVSSADWSKVHHVTQGIFCNDRWWRFAGHYSIEPTGHYLRARVLWILYCKLGLRVQNPHPRRTASCARFLIVEPTER